jgi:TetR/AcrR family transcriptional repressor of lmrAB and yxaGH operons
MIQAARQLIRERGYNATALSDVLELSEAPRGSVYFHFPGGKRELAIEAVGAHAAEQVEIIDQAAAASHSAAELVEVYLGSARDRMLGSNYRRGCGIAPLVTEGAAADSAEVGESSRQAFAAMIDRLTSHFSEFGLDLTVAADLADAVVAGLEGAMITARALRSPSPYDALRVVLVDSAERVSVSVRD